MTLFGKSRVQEELPDEDSHSVASREKGPPPYVYGDAAGQGASDSKASLASSDDVKGAWVDDSLEELDPEAVWLDAVKHKHGCTSVVRRGSDDAVYTATKDRRWLSSTLHLFHGSVPHDPEQRPASALPYATLKSSSIFLRETSDQIEPTEYKSRQVIRAAKWGLPSIFTVGGTEYRIRVLKKSLTGKLILTIANDPTQAPLCVFRPARKIFAEIRSSLEILPIAVSTSSTPKTHALLHDGCPTKLLDMALIAENVVRTYQYNSNTAPATFGSSASVKAAIVC